MTFNILYVTIFTSIVKWRFRRVIRTGFGDMSSFLAQFTDQIKNLCALDTKGMTVRNAIVKLNKDQVSTGAFDPTLLSVSRGGLPKPMAASVTSPTGLGSLLASWTPAEGATISVKAKVIIICATEDGSFTMVGTALNSIGACTMPGAVPGSTGLHCYIYLLDYRGSSRVGSRSEYIALTTAAA